MKPREIVLDQIRHVETDTVPYRLGIEPEIAAALDTHYGSPSWRVRIQEFMVTTHAVETMRRLPPERPGYERDPFGSLWRTDKRPFHLEEPGLTQPSFQGYHWPAPEEFFCDKEALEAARQLCTEKKDDQFIIASLMWGLFESGWGLRGFENIMMDMASEQEFYQELLDRVTEQFLVYVEFTCDQLPDVDAIMFGDDWGDQRGVMGGPDRWRELFKPRYKKIFDRVHQKGKITISHCCGSVVDIMPDIIEAGLDVLESVQPEARGMNPYELKAAYGGEIAFYGCLGSQSTIPFGTPDGIHAEVRKLKREMGAGGGFILSPAKALQPETPIENAVAVVEAFVGDSHIDSEIAGVTE